MTIAKLWSSLNGSWTDWNNAYVDFKTSGSSYYLITGVHDSNSSINQGEAKAMSILSEGQYKVSVQYSSETKDIYIDMGVPGDSKISVKLPGGSYAEYTQDLDDRPSTTPTPTSGQGVFKNLSSSEVYQLWERLSGTWASSDNKYVKLELDDMSSLFSSGVLESEPGRSPGNVVVVKTNKINSYVATIHFASQLATETTGAYDEMECEVVLDTSQTDSGLLGIKIGDMPSSTYKRQ
jgi:hypothetical protein